MIENKLVSATLSSDHALLLKDTHKPKKSKRNITLGFTVRNWFKGSDQLKFENDYASAISKFAGEYDVNVQPILQVEAPDYEIEDDRPVTERVINELKREGAEVLHLKKVKGLESARKIYSSIDLLLGMRMHSNIIAATQGTPFLAISYEYKTEGIAEQLGMEKYCIRADEVNKNSLYRLLVQAYENREKSVLVIKKSLNTIKNREYKYWNKTLSLSI
jgi:colanic acid/amylovoran biosynthesis protein